MSSGAPSDRQIRVIGVVCPPRSRRQRYRVCPGRRTHSCTLQPGRISARHSPVLSLMYFVTFPDAWALEVTPIAIVKSGSKPTNEGGAWLSPKYFIETVRPSSAAAHLPIPQKLVDWTRISTQWSRQRH